MNQILQTKIKNSSDNGKKKSFLKVQFYISIFVFLSLSTYLFFYWQNLQKSELYSDSLLSNYNLTRLYANSESSNIYILVLFLVYLMPTVMIILFWELSKLKL